MNFNIIAEKTILKQKNLLIQLCMITNDKSMHLQSLTRFSFCFFDNSSFCYGYATANAVVENFLSHYVTHC